MQGGEGVLAGDVQGRARGDPRLSGAKERSEGLRPAPVVAEEDTLADPKHRCHSQRATVSRAAHYEKIIKLKAMNRVWITSLTPVVLFFASVRLAYGTKRLTGVY